MALDVDRIDRIVETVCTPIPLAHRLVRGIGFDGGRPIVCVVLTTRTTTHTPQQVTAVLLVGAGPVSWALCTDQIHGVVPLVARATVIDPRLPRWLRRARSQDGRMLAYLDPIQMVLDIGGAS